MEKAIFSNHFASFYPTRKEQVTFEMNEAAGSRVWFEMMAADSTAALTIDRRQGCVMEQEIAYFPSFKEEKNLFLSQ